MNKNNYYRLVNKKVKLQEELDYLKNLISEMKVTNVYDQECITAPDWVRSEIKSMNEKQDHPEFELLSHSGYVAEII